MREYQILMSRDQLDLWNAIIKHQYAPTEKTKAELEKLSKESDEKLKRWQEDAETQFIARHGEATFEMVKSISDKYFLVGKSAPFYLSWVISSDESDNYYLITFSQGYFDYVEDIAGGYAGRNILEHDIRFSRVLELLKTQN